VTTKERKSKLACKKSLRMSLIHSDHWKESLVSQETQTQQRKKSEIEKSHLTHLEKQLGVTPRVEWGVDWTVGDPIPTLEVSDP
jgi:hypothetical protein